jgi:hypothetical protein
MRVVITALAILSLAWLAGSVDARTWYVKSDGSGDAPTIQAAIDSVLYYGGDILLADGTYQGPGNRDLQARWSFSLHSESGDPTSCIIDCQGTAGNPYTDPLREWTPLRDRV